MSAERAVLAGRRVVVTGATSESGIAVSLALVEAGADVVAVSVDEPLLREFAERVPGARTELSDLSDSAAVDDLAASIEDVDGVIHLVGGWVGGSGIEGQTDAGWESMERSFRTLRNVTRAFYPALLSSPSGRMACVSSITVESPRADGAHYTAAKAASESWMRSIADGFRAAGADTPEVDAAATILVAKALVDGGRRAANPDRSFAGFTDVSDLAVAVLDLWAVPAAEINGVRIALPTLGSPAPVDRSGRS